MVAPVFDFTTLAAPFRMQPGLRRLAPDQPQLTALAPGSALWREKKAVVDAGASRLAVPGFDAGPALAAVRARAAAEGLAFAEPLELAFEQDFAVLEGAGGTLPWLAVCVPSHWAPEDKIGLSFAAVHAPVADNQLLVAARQQLVQLATGGGCWERWVWTVTPSARHDQHPRRHPRAAWPAGEDPAAFAAQCHLRAERQTFFPVDGAVRQAVFTIHVRVQPLAQAVAAPGQAAGLLAALSSMSDAVLAYKGLTEARAPLVAWLRERCG